MTAQEYMKQYKLEQRKERNRKAYHTDDIRKYSGKIVASSNSWHYVLTVYDDNSAVLRAIAKPNTGCRDCHYCGTNQLKSHLRDMVRYKKTMKKTTIPDDWIVINHGFFAALGIA